ncbi:hypothetical protein SUDANB140_00831 [Streptomyces sp. enrichment culture]
MTYPNLHTPEEHLTTAKTKLDIPTVTAICGSTRFMDQMTDADRELTWRGHIVVKPGCDMKTPHPLWADPADAEDGKVRLDALHRAKIRLADEVLVVGDYVGSSTIAEIAYARSLGKPVRFTHPDVDPGGPASENERCGKCRQPFDPSDTRFDGHARHKDTPYCRGCVDRCHDNEVADHRCVICA